MDGIKICIKIICRVQVRCLWVILTKKEVNNWLSWQFNNSDFRLVLGLLNNCCKMAANASNVIDTLLECVHQSVKAQVSLLLWWLETKQPIVYC